jgi:hypothetical protein
LVEREVEGGRALESNPFMLFASGPVGPGWENMALSGAAMGVHTQAILSALIPHTPGSD